MPNGFYGSKEEWEQMVAPLRELDADIRSFAAAHRLAVMDNYHNLPNRMLRWNRGGIEHVIQISLHSGDKILFSIFAYKDEGDRRRGKRWPPEMEIPLPEFKANLVSRLTEAHQTLATVSADDLEDWG
jgi:hypothetical protein